MPHNSMPPDWWSHFATYAWVFLLSLWGGTVHTIRKIKEGQLARFSISEWVGDIVVSGFIGFVTYAFCQYAGFDGWLSAVLIGIASHQGTRGLAFIEQVIARKVKGVD